MLQQQPQLQRHGLLWLACGPGSRARTSLPSRSLCNASSPNACENVTLASPTRARPLTPRSTRTSTASCSSQNPSSVNQQVTYTATVTATATATQDPVPNSPTGTVTFKDGSTAICSAVAVTSTGTTTATATCQQTYTSTSGSPHSITAVYSNTDGNFDGSTSSPLSQVVQSSLATARRRLSLRHRTRPTVGTR